MFPQHCFKTVCCYEKKSWSCKLWLKRTHLSLFSTDRLDQHQESSYEKKHLALRAEALREWLKCILDTHRTPCDALLPLAHADAFFQGGAFLEHQIPAAVRIPGPHTGTDRAREKEQMLVVKRKFMATLISWKQTKEAQKWKSHVTRNPIFLMKAYCSEVLQLTTSFPVQKHDILTLNHKYGLWNPFWHHKLRL